MSRPDIERIKKALEDYVKGSPHNYADPMKEDMIVLLGYIKELEEDKHRAVFEQYENQAKGTIKRGGN